MSRDREFSRIGWLARLIIASGSLNIGRPEEANDPTAAVLEQAVQPPER